MTTARTTETRNLYQKLAAISGELGAITKDSQAPQEMGGFRFMSHAALMGHLREKLAEQQVAILESLELVSDDVVTMKTQQGERTNRRIVVKLTAEFVNAEKPDDRHSVTWFGEGIDRSDKALQKAGTSAEKYMLSKTFKVSDKDDPDSDSSGEITTPRERPKAKPVPPLGNGQTQAKPAESGELDPDEKVCPKCGMAGTLRRKKDDEERAFCAAGMGGCGKSFAASEVVTRAEFHGLNVEEPAGEVIPLPLGDGK